MSFLNENLISKREILNFHSKFYSFFVQVQFQQNSKVVKKENPPNQA